MQTSNIIRDINEQIIRSAVRELKQEGYSYKLFSSVIFKNYGSFKNFMCGKTHTTNENLIKLKDFINEKFDKEIVLKEK